MWLLKVFSVIYFTAACVAQDPQHVTSMPMSPTTDEPEWMETSYVTVVLPSVYEPPVPSLQQQSDWLDVFPSEQVEFSCNISGSSDWNISWHRNNQSLDADPNASFSADGSVLTITIETQTYSGSYFCQGLHKTKGVSTQSSNSLEVNVHANNPKPTVSRRPNHDRMFLGESVTFTCAVEAAPGWEYLWYRNGKEIQATKTASYTILLNPSYSGLYSCKAWRGKGPFNTEMSETQSLQVSDRPTTSLKLLSQWPDVFKDEIVQLKCKVEGPGQWIYTWYKDQKKFQMEEWMNDEDFPFLNFTVVSQADQGDYACRAHLDSRNVSSELSNSTTVIVYENTPKPTVSKVPDFAQMYVGETVNFTCEVDVSSGWSYQWYINGTFLPSATGKTITISLSAGGKYLCEATRGEATSTPQSEEIQQVVHEIPVPDLKNTTQWLDVFPSESVTLSCDMQRGADWTYTWRRDGQKVQADDAVSFDSNGKTLSISSASAKHAGKYDCNGHLQGRSVSSSSSQQLTLTVYDKKPSVVLTQDPDYEAMFPGESVSFSCRLDVSSGWEYLYYKERNELASGITYSINSVGTANRGSYTCQAKRGKTQVFFSGSSQVMHFEVKKKKPKPLTTQEPKADKVYVGESVSFDCKVDVSSGWEYHWMKDGIARGNSSVFKIQDASSSDSGSYECVAKRDKSAYHTLYSDKRLLQISEIPVPDLKQMSPWLDVFPTESVKLSCGMEVSSDWTYTWYKDGRRVQADSTVSLGTNGTTLSIASASAKHAGQYKCSGRLNSRPVDSTNSSGLTLSVYGTKPKVTLTRQPEDEVMHTGDPVSFSCHINVSSGWEYLWYKDGSPLAESEITHTISSSVTKHTGSYSCRVKRGRNAVFQSDLSQAVRLNIQERPQANIILLTGWSEVFATDSLALKCEVLDSQDMWNYTWFRVGQHIDLPPSERHEVTPKNDPEQSVYTCHGIRTGRPFYSKLSDSFKTTNLLLKRRVLLSISGCLFFGLIAVIVGCIVLRIFRKPVRNEDQHEEENLFLTMAQLKNRTDAPNPLVEYITDAALNASPKEMDENGTICSETTPLPISTPEDQAVTTEGDGTDEDKGGLVSFKQ